MFHRFCEKTKQNHFDYLTCSSKIHKLIPHSDFIKKKYKSLSNFLSF